MYDDVKSEIEKRAGRAVTAGGGGGVPGILLQDSLASVYATEQSTINMLWGTK